MNLLPPFPMDDSTLELLWKAIHPGPEAPRTSLQEFLDLMSEMGGSDPKAVTEEAGILIVRDQMYTDYDLITALLKEVWRVKKALYICQLKRAGEAEIIASLRDRDASPDS